MENLRFAFEASRQAVCIPARSTAYVEAVGERMGQTAVFELLTTGCGRLLITNTTVVNPTKNDF
jgi:hypothetical protein